MNDIFVAWTVVGSLGFVLALMCSARLIHNMMTMRKQRVRLGLLGAHVWGEGRAGLVPAQCLPCQAAQRRWRLTHVRASAAVLPFLSATLRTALTAAAHDCSGSGGGR